MSYLRRLSPALAAAAMALLGLNLPDAQAETIVGLTTANELFSFDSATPGVVTPLVAVTGITGDLIGIDFRPSDGLLYGISTTNNLYTIDASTGVASAPIALFADPGDLTSPFAGLAGDFYGFDFNPVADRLRIVSGNGQNLRIDPNTGATFTDGALNGAAATAEFAAYSNNVAGAASTTLFVIDSASDSLYQQSPPNDGTTTLLGPLGADVLAEGGFDISGATGIAYLGANVSGVLDPTLHTIDLTTGAQTLVGGIGVPSGIDIRDITVPVVVPETGTVALLSFGLLGGAALRRRRKPSSVVLAS